MRIRTTRGWMRVPKKIREIGAERSIHGLHEAKVMMTTSLSDPESLSDAICEGGATAYLVKPMGKASLVNELRKLGLATQCA